MLIYLNSFSWISFLILNISCSNLRFYSTREANNFVFSLRLSLILILNLSKNYFFIFFSFFSLTASLASWAVVLAVSAVFPYYANSCYFRQSFSSFLAFFYNLSILAWYSWLPLFFLVCLSIWTSMYFILACISTIFAYRSRGSFTSRVPII